MSPRKRLRSESPAVTAAVSRLWIAFGMQVRDARMSRRWSVHELANRAGLSAEFVYLVEAGRSGSAEAAARLASALGRKAQIDLVDPRRKQLDAPTRSVDLVHSGMGECEAARLRANGVNVGIDEPYQHFQFAGRADLIAWDIDARALLHLENRTRFPDIQETAGSFNAKRAYLGTALADRLGIRGWASETHAIVGLWSAEVLHVLRIREQTFRAMCADPGEGFAAWWRGEPAPRGTRSELVVLDPLAVGRQRAVIGLDDALSARPRHRGYADVADKMAGKAAGTLGPPA